MYSTPQAPKPLNISQKNLESGSVNHIMYASTCISSSTSVIKQYTITNTFATLYNGHKADTFVIAVL